MIPSANIEKNECTFGLYSDFNIQSVKLFEVKFIYFSFLILSFLACVGLAAPDTTLVSSAKIQGFTITSETLSRDIDKGIIFLEGNVKIIYQNQFYEADQVEINLKKKQAHLVGQVKIQTPTFSMTGKEMKLDYESGQGLIFYGSVQSNNIRFQGDVIEKLNDTDFYVTNADYTTCSNCPSTWSFEGSRIRAELGGYAYLKNSFLRLGGVPVFWLPYLVVPLKSDRQTGLLTPEYGYKNDRKSIFSQSLFWAISRSQDATFTLKNYEIGGVKPLVEYRYVQSPDSFGQINASYIRDPLFSSDNRYKTYRQDDEKDKIFNRWALKTYNQYFLDKNDKLQLQIALVSDLQYPKDFSEEFKNYSDPALENRLTYSHLMEHSLISLDSSYYKNLLQADPLSANNNSVHRLPELRFESTYKKFDDLPLYYKFESTWVNFQRSKAYDDTSISSLPDSAGQKYASNITNDPRCDFRGDPNCTLAEDQIYNENQDLIRTGQRANIKASLTTDTFNAGDIVNFSPTVSYNEAQYYFPVGESRFNARRYVQFDLNTRTKFYRVYDNDYEKTEVKYKNEIIPEFQYSLIPWIEQSAHPFFGNYSVNNTPYSSRTVIQDSDINTPGGLLYDYDDRVYDRHVLSFSLLNRLVRKKKKDNSYKTVVNFRLTQSYDLYQAQYGQNKNQPLSDLSGTLTLDFDQIQNYTQVNYFPYSSATDTTTTLSYLNEQQQYFKIGWASKRSTDPKQDDFSFAIGFVSSYINVLTGVVFDASADRDNSSRLKKFSLITQLKPPGECWAVNFYRDQKVAVPEAEWRFTFDFSFDGKPTKVIPPAELNIN